MKRCYQIELYTNPLHVIMRKHDDNENHQPNAIIKKRLPCTLLSKSPVKTATAMAFSDFQCKTKKKTTDMAMTNTAIFCK